MPDSPNLRGVSYKERRRRIDEALHQAWMEERKIPSDPGLRKAYFEASRAPVRLIVPSLQVYVNHGGLLRLAEAFRIERVEFEPEPDGAFDIAGAVGADRWQPSRWISNPEAIAEAQADGYHIYGLTLDERSRDLSQIDWTFPAALVVGREKEGILSHVAEACDELVAIPLYGIIGSLNLTAATAIALQAMVGSYARLNPAFQPLRNASRVLAGLDPIHHPPSHRDPDQGPV